MQAARRGWLAAAILVPVVLGVAAARQGPVVQSSAVAPEGGIDVAIAAAQAELDELEKLGETWRRQEAAQRAALQQQLEAVLVLESQLSDAERGSSRAEGIFDRLKPLVGAAIEGLDRVIRAAGQPLQLRGLVAASATEVGGGSLGGGEREAATLHSAAAATLSHLEEQVADKLAELEREEVALRQQSVERYVALAGRIWRLRVAALHKLPRDRRAEVFSLSGEGRVELETEMEALRVVWRLQLLRTKVTIAVASQQLRSFLTAFRIGAGTIQIVLVVLVWKWALAKRNRYLEKLRARSRQIEDDWQRQWAASGVEFLASLAPWGLFLLMVLALRWIVGEQAERVPGVPALYALALVYGIYRLIADLIVGMATEAFKRGGLGVSEALAHRLARRVRWVLRSAALLFFLLWVIQHRLGEGLIYSHARTWAWVVTAAVLFLALGGLREQITELFLAERAHGRLADLVRRTQGRWSGRFVAPLAFAFLVALAMLSVVRNIAFSFERTRTAGAYLSRRRLEKSAEREGYASGRLDQLPAELVAALDSGIRVDDLEQLELLPEREDFDRAVADWRGEEGGGSFLLAGDEGVGKRALVSHVAARQAVERLELDRRLLDPKALRGWLGGALLGRSAAPARAELIDELNEGPRRIVVIERAERLFLSAVNGYHALAELGPVIDGTRRQVFWALSIGGLAWSHLRAAGKDLAFLRRQVTIPPWKQSQIAALIGHRLASVGAKVSYADLAGREGRQEDRQARDRRGEAAFMSLLADFCGGNPKVALHYLVRSLEPGADGVFSVRPFRRPDEDELEAVGDATLFILAAVARHGSLTPQEAARATDYELDRVQARLARLDDLDAVRSAEGAYRLTTGWRSTVLRVLRRHNILIS